VRACLVASVIAVAAPARADGVFFEESFGVANARGPLAPIVAGPLHVRVGAGMRLGDFALEPWVLSDLATDRMNAWKGIVGGDPVPGAADLESYGLDAKYIMPIDQRLSTFVRTGPFVASGNGALSGYSGRGIGIAGGAQITGRVRALGFLFSPLFFVKRGPFVTGALFLDAGYDFYWLRGPNGDTITARVGHVSVGFGVGSAF
jgi:hypothetical protein